MPELPEVETIRMGLEKYLVGHKIVGVDVKLAKMVTGNTAHVIGAKVKAIRRAGKGLIIDLDNDYSIAIHVKLTGQLIYRGPNAPKVVHLSKSKVGSVPNKFTHVTFTLDRGGVLYYNDFRQFGWIKIVKEDEVAKLPFFKELGPEFTLPNLKSTPAQKKLTRQMFVEILSKSAAPVKAVLMDQQKMGGVGNIYANDGLYLAGIDPRRKAKSLSDVEMKKLYESLLEVLKRGLTYGGASELAFVDALGQEGNYQKYFLVYGQEDEACPNRNGIIRKIKLGGRGTYFCEKCQR